MKNISTDNMEKRNEQIGKTQVKICKTRHVFYEEYNKVIYNNFYLYRVLVQMPLSVISDDLKKLAIQREEGGFRNLSINKRIIGLSIDAYMPALSTLCLISYALNCTPDDIMGYPSEIYDLIYDKEKNDFNDLGNLLILLSQCEFEELVNIKNAIIDYLNENVKLEEKIEKTKERNCKIVAKDVADFPLDECFNELTTRIKTLRDADTQTHVAECLGIHQATYQTYEAGNANMSINILFKICDLYHRTMTEMLDPDKKYFRNTVLYTKGGKPSIYNKIIKLASMLPEDAFEMLYCRVENKKFETRTLITDSNIFSEDNKNIYTSRRERIDNAKYSRASQIHVRIDK